MDKSIVLRVAWWLIIIGAFNWGLYGLAGLFGANGDPVRWVLSSLPALKNILFLLMGVSALLLLLGRKSTEIRKSSYKVPQMSDPTADRLF